MKIFLATLVLFLSSAHSFGAEKPKLLGDSSMPLLESKIQLDKGYGMGYYFDAASTESKNLVNQGFAMLSLFQYTDAFRSFNSALAEDPSLKIAAIGRAFASRSLDASNRYYTDIALDLLKKNLDTLDEATLSWGNLLNSIIKKRDLNNQPLSSRQAYKNLKETHTPNPDIKAFANWVSGSRLVSDFQDVLKSYPDHAGALHYMLHISEGKNDHKAALSFGEKLISRT